ncbi:MAG: phosphoheptose isomerase [Bacteroidota bacterium]|nr:phosphoheptose isomerase [Bacteroidota bacterium]
MEHNIFDEIERKIKNAGLTIFSKDHNRPWGGFFVIDEDQAQLFANVFLNGLDVSNIKISGKLSPKILLVKPHTRLSWQYHHRRAELWRVIEGKVGIVRSETDEEKELQTLNTFDEVTLKQGERHRLVGLEDWAIIAEIWQHTDPNNPSNEEDIVRVQDDYGR